MNCGQSLVETVKLLGCFSASLSPPNGGGLGHFTERLQSRTRKPDECHYKNFHEIFTSDIGDFHRLRKGIPTNIFAACVVLRMLYDMAVDNYEKSKSRSGPKSPMLRADDTSSTSSNEETPRPSGQQQQMLLAAPVRLIFIVTTARS